MVIINDYGLNDKYEKLNSMLINNNPVGKILDALSELLSLQKSVVETIKANLELNQDVIELVDNSLSNAYKIIDKLSEKATEDWVQVRLAEIALELSHITKEINLSFEEINRQNTGFFKMLLGGVIVATGVLIGSVAFAIGNRSSSNDMLEEPETNLSLEDS